MSNELYIMTSVTSLDAVDADGVAICCVASLAAIEVMHGKRGIA